MANNGSPEYDLKSYKAGEITPFEGHTFDMIREQYYTSQLPGVSRATIRDFIEATSAKGWNKPNKNVGTVHARAGQGFARQRVTSLHSNETPGQWSGGLVLTADNASSSEGGVVGKLEIAAKLYVPVKRFQSRRYRAIREIIGTSEGIIDHLIDDVFGKTKDWQPIVAYTFSCETMVNGVLTANGFKRNPDFRPEVPVFDATADTPAVFLDRYDLQD